MNDTALLQRIGTFATLFMAIVLARVAFHVKAWCFYGRETAMVVASAMVWFGVIRLCRTELGLYDAYDATVFNAYSAIAHSVILAGVIVLHYVRHRHLRRGCKYGYQLL